MSFKPIYGEMNQGIDMSLRAQNRPKIEMETIKVMCPCVSHQSQRNNSSVPGVESHRCHLCGGVGFTYEDVPFYSPKGGVEDVDQHAIDSSWREEQITAIKDKHLHRPKVEAASPVETKDNIEMSDEELESRYKELQARKKADGGFKVLKVKRLSKKDIASSPVIDLSDLAGKTIMPSRLHEVDIATSHYTDTSAPDAPEWSPVGGE